MNHSVRTLIKKSEAALESGDISFALRIVHDFVEKIITEPICASQIFSSYELDQLCLRIGQQNLVDLIQSEDNFWPEHKTEATVIYLVSRIQKSGGHSRLIQDFIRLQPEKNHLILSTEIGGPSDIKYFSLLFSKYDNVRFEYACRESFQARLCWLQSILLRYRDGYVYLFNHHQDSIAVAAITPELSLKGSFIHHGDHHLCLGVHLRHLNHVDLHPMGYHHCRNELRVNGHYLPLTFDDKGWKFLETEFSKGGALTTATAARSNKVEIPYYVSYLDIIPKVLKVTGGRHVHLGKLSPWALRRIHSQMRSQGISRNRFIYIEWVPSVWEALQAYKVDVYVASFPYGAGLTLIEAMGAGVPVIMHEHMYSRVLSSLELAYPGSFRWNDPDELLNYLPTLTPEKLEKEKKCSRLQYELFHRPELLQSFLQNPEKILPIEVPSLDKNFRTRNDEWASWVESQLTFKRLIYRFFYRLFRALRRF